MASANQAQHDLQVLQNLHRLGKLTSEHGISPEQRIRDAQGNVRRLRRQESRTGRKGR